MFDEIIVIGVWHSSSSPKLGEVAAKQTEEYDKHFYTAPAFYILCSP